MPPALLQGALEEWAPGKGEHGSRQHHNRHTVETILKTYSPEEVNWSAVANLLGVSRQAVHQIKRRLMAPVMPDRQLALPLDDAPLAGGLPTSKRPARTRTPHAAAVILAGGAGTRLRPLTLTRRKELFPLLNRPLLENRLRNLRDHGVTDVILACSEGMREIEQEFGDGARLGLTLRYSYQHHAFRSGRAIKQAARALGAAGTLIVCNPDIVTDINLRAMLRSHYERRAMISLSLKAVDDPWHFGVVRMRSDGRVTGFVEKPAAGLQPSNLVNAGTWLWEPEVLDRIPDDTSAMRDGFVERVLFPAAVEDGLRVQGFIEDGLWVDVDSPEGYLRATELLVANNASGPTRQIGNATSVQFVGKSVVAESVHMGDGVRIIGPSVIGDGCSIGDRAVIDRCVLWEDVRVGADSQLVGTIAGRAVVVGARASLIDAVLGDGARIGDDVHLDVGAHMQPGEVCGGTPARGRRSAQRV